MMPRTRVASAITHAVADCLAQRSPSVAIKIGTQENKQLTLLLVHNSPAVTREAVPL